MAGMYRQALAACRPRLAPRGTDLPNMIFATIAPGVPGIFLLLQDAFPPNASKEVRLTPSRREAVAPNGASATHDVCSPHCDQGSVSISSHPASALLSRLPSQHRIPYRCTFLVCIAYTCDNGREQPQLKAPAKASPQCAIHAAAKRIM